MGVYLCINRVFIYFSIRSVCVDMVWYVCLTSLYLNQCVQSYTWCYVYTRCLYCKTYGIKGWFLIKHHLRFIYAIVCITMMATVRNIMIQRLVLRLLGGWTFSTKYFCVKVALCRAIEGPFQLAFEMMNGNEFWFSVICMNAMRTHICP